MGEIPTDSASRVETGPNAVDSQRELERLRTEVVQARARADSATQEAAEHANAVARLLQENKNLNNEMEHLRVILNQKDAVLGDLRGAPEALMTELAQLRQNYEEASAKLARIEAERDVAQTELARRSLAHEQAEAELRLIKHQHEHLTRLTVSQHDAGADLTKVLRDKAELTDDLALARQRITAVDEQLAACLTSVENMVAELGLKVYALRAAMARTKCLSTEHATHAPLYEAFDQLLAHLDEGNNQLRGLRKLVKPQSSGICGAEAALS